MYVKKVQFMIVRVTTKSILILLLSFIYSHSFSQSNAVEAYGQLSVSGTQLIDKNGNAVQLRGMSLFWSQWEPEFYVANTVDQLQNEWCTNVIRCAMAVEEGGYLTDSVAEEQRVRAVVEACISRGMYVIIDWHDHNADLHTQRAVNFFSRMSKDYGDQPNVLFEIFNEPINQNWSTTVKPYSEAVITAIRQHSNNIIICGTPRWSQNVDDASADPITGQINIMYTLHYYAGTHKQFLRNKATTAINAGLALFVTEFGTVNSDGGGAVDVVSSNEWFDYLDQHKLSYCNWSLADKDEGSAIITPGTSPSDSYSNNLTLAGSFMFDRFIETCPVYDGDSSMVVVTFTNPTMTTFNTGDEIIFSVDASYESGTITSVEFFDGNVSLGIDDTAPYSITTSDLKAGSRSIKAKATSNSGKIGQAFKTIDLQLTILKTDATISIDGTIESIWTTTTPIDLENIISGGSAISNLSDFSAKTWLLWDDNYLYALIKVKDDSKNSNSINAYQDDGVELFIDINNDKLSTYGVNDFHYFMRYDDETITEGKGKSTNNILIGQTENVFGYTLEFAIPWATINETNPESGDVIGFDLQGNDDDEGSTGRNSSIAWNTSSDDAWENPSIFGTIILSDIITNKCINSSPDAPSISGPDEICRDLNGNNFEYSVPFNSGSTYNWSLTNATFVSGEDTENITVEFLAGTVASVKVTETNSENCTSDTSALTVTNECPTGNSPLEDNDLINIYPNPFNDALNIEGFSFYELSNIDGRVIQSGVINNGVIDTKDINPSVYHLKVVNNQYSKTIKVIKE